MRLLTKTKAGRFLDGLQELEHYLKVQQMEPMCYIQVTNKSSDESTISLSGLVGDVRLDTSSSSIILLLKINQEGTR